MSDAMDSDVREVIRRRIAIRERDGHERLLLNHEALLALLDAADERDRIKTEMGDPSRHYIMDGWLVIDTGEHTCGTGPGGHYGAHEPGCGLEQALRLDNLPGWPGGERDRLAAALARAQGPFTCCSHCEGDAIHDVEANAHEVPCTLCQSSIGEVERLRAERDRLAAAAERVRELHERDGEGFCVVCDYMTPHPCPTLRALGGADDE